MYKQPKIYETGYEIELTTKDYADEDYIPILQILSLSVFLCMYLFKEKLNVKIVVYGFGTVQRVRLRSASIEIKG